MTNPKTTTDWDRYYSSIPVTALITRRITANKLCRHLKDYTAGTTSSSVVELGGANSWFIDTVRDAIKPSRYACLDLNEKGLALLEQRYESFDNVQGIRADALALTEAQKAVPAP